MDSSVHIPAIWWIGTLLWFFVLLFGDLLLHRGLEKKLSFKSSVLRSFIWIGLGALLGAVIWINFGHEAGTKYFSGYLIEKALSIDNIFVWGVILGYLKIPQKYHYKVLFWGIFGAIVFRTIFVFVGIAIIEKFEPALLVLGFVLLISAIRLLRDRSEGFDPTKSRTIKLVDKIFPVSTKLNGNKLFVKDKGRTAMSLLLFAIIIIEVTDILFAVDSVPATLAISRHPYLVLSSNIAAILGLRALYFVFDGLREKFSLLNKALALILAYIGITLMLSPDEIFGYQWFAVTVPTILNLGLIGAVFLLSIVGSMFSRKRTITYISRKWSKPWQR